MSTPPVLSVVVPLGFVNQTNKEDPQLGDEFDHMAALATARSSVELVIVDRAWPTRLDRVQQALEVMLDRVVYIPPKPSAIISHGYRAASSMRNSGAICSSGKVLAFVDDFCWLDGGVADEVCRYYEETGLMLCPLFHENQEGQIPDDQVQVFSGHSPAVYMCTRDDFVAINGFDENFDGAYGEEDTEFQNRLDRLLWLRGQNAALRRRRRGLFWRRTWHMNGVLPEQRRLPWDGINTETGYLRCNRSYFQRVAQIRIEANETKGNVAPTDEELDRLRGYRCTDACGVCQRADREKQIASYQGLFRVDESVGDCVSKTQARYGSFDPWVDQREADA